MIEVIGFVETKCSVCNDNKKMCRRVHTKEGVFNVCDDHSLEELEIE
jgi:hypothetical protein